MVTIYHGWGMIFYRRNESDKFRQNIQYYKLIIVKTD
jgi:hypothetical protein